MFKNFAKEFLSGIAHGMIQGLKIISVGGGVYM